MPAAYAFDCDLSFRGAVKMFDAMENWVHKPNLDGRWLVRDNDRVGDYLSYYAYDEGDRSIVKSVCLFFDTRPRQVTLDVSRARTLPAGKGDLQSAWLAHKAYVLDVLLPSIGARNVKVSDFEK